jgi:acylphosphatase
MSKKDNVRLYAIVAGMVQGVSFRWYTQRRASELGLVGYVRNLREGSVEVCAEGSRDSLERLLDAVRIGPSSAVVENVDTKWSEASGEFRRFDIRF